MDPTRPEWPIGPPRRRPRTLWSDLAGLWHRYRDLPLGAQLIGLVVAILVVIALFSLVTGGSGGNTKVASKSPTTRRGPTLPVLTTTTLPPLPAGDDKTVKGVIDGDSFETADGVKVRLIGIDAPDVETEDCFSAEATSHLRDLLPAGRTVRLVYDATTTDRLGRTLAYVYRLPDGLFINVALAKDGYAIELPSQTNTAHASDIAAAVADAKAASRGLWKACSTTTTASRSATTSGTSATTAPPATEESTTSTTQPVGSTTTSAPSGSTSTSRFPF